MNHGTLETLVAVTEAWNSRDEVVQEIMDKYSDSVEGWFGVANALIEFASDMDQALTPAWKAERREFLLDTESITQHWQDLILEQGFGVTFADALCSLEGDFCSPCPSCSDRGFILTDAKYPDLQACDTCLRYDNDSEAQEACFRRLMEAEEVIELLAQGNTEIETLEQRASEWLERKQS